MHLWTDQTQRLDPGATPMVGGVPLRVLSSRPMGGTDRYLVQFEGVTDREGADRLRGADLEAEPIEVPGTLWVHELVGARCATPPAPRSGGWRRSRPTPPATCWSSSRAG